MAIVIQGTAVAKFDNETPIVLEGEWSIDTEIPVFRGYGQGDGTPGSGYIGSSLGTGQRVSGSFRFQVDASGDLVKRYALDNQRKFFTIAWVIGDPALSRYKAQAEDCHMDSISQAVNNPEGRFQISGRMSAGAVSGPAFALGT